MKAILPTTHRNCVYTYSYLITYVNFEYHMIAR
jgi:hypothetical protein